MIYDEITIKPVDTQVFSHYRGEDVPLYFSRLCKRSKRENMQPLTVRGILENPLGLALVGIYSGPRCFEKHVVLGHAAITAINATEGEAKVATVGGVLLMPDARGRGLGHNLLGALLESAATEIPSLAGFDAVCNSDSLPMFSLHGFKVLKDSGGKVAVTRPA